MRRIAAGSVGNVGSGRRLLDTICRNGEPAPTNKQTRVQLEVRDRCTRMSSGSATGDCGCLLSTDSVEGVSVLVGGGSSHIANSKKCSSAHFTGCIPREQHRWVRLTQHVEPTVSTKQDRGHISLLARGHAAQSAVLLALACRVPIRSAMDGTKRCFLPSQLAFYPFTKSFRSTFVSVSWPVLVTRTVSLIV